MKALIADDDADLRALIAFTLTQGGFEVCSAADGDAAVRLFDAETPELLLVDINMPVLDGLQVCREIRRRSNVPIMVLTVRDQEEDLVTAFDSGADDYVRKPFSPRTLLARVRALMRRSDPTSSPLLEVGPVKLDFEQHTFQVEHGKEIHLTPLELRAMHLLMTSAGRTVTADRLLMHVWNRNTARERRILKQLIYRLRHKLEQNPAAPDLLQTTPGAGYKLAPPGWNGKT